MLKLDPVALTDVGRKRDHNEDYLGDLIIRNAKQYGSEKLAARGYLFAIADGMGGYAAGEVASELAITTLFETYYTNLNSNNLAEDLSEAIHVANFKVHSAGNDPGRRQMGTTLTLALIVGNRALVGNVGDSRTYLIRQGIALRLTRDHSLVQDQIDIGAITPEQAEKSLVRNVITRAIGHRDEVEPDFFEKELEKGDVLMLCSDGLHGQMSEMEIGTIVATAPNLQVAAKQLIDLANERGGPDNISVLLIGITEVGEPHPPLLPPNMVQNGTTMTLQLPVAQQATARATTLNGTSDDSYSSGITATAKNPTVDNPTVKQQVKGLAEQSTSVMPATPATNERSPIAFVILALVVLLIAGVIAFLVLSNNSSSGTPTSVPSLTSPAATTTQLPSVTPAPTALATVTPAPSLNGTNQGGSAASERTASVATRSPSPSPSP